jgi:DNA polymerase-3 subunit gamma/tau
MSYQALARKWRPQTFRDVLGQETIVRTLRNAIEGQRIHHAYLFSGVRGVGKTTTARILAKAINCVEGPTIEPCNKCGPCTEITEGIDLDVREIDAATYTQVDNIRELREVSQFQPARDRRRIFIIDEAHMLSSGAWNALLKLIEEPPPHVVFIMATTEMQKVPATILSRVQQFVFRKITQADFVTRLQEICREEGIEAEPRALELIAARGEGSARDSLSLLDQVIAFSGKKFTAADVASILGVSDEKLFVEVMGLIHAGDAASLLEKMQEAAESGRDFKLLFKDFLAYARALLLLASGARNIEGDDESRSMAESIGYTDLLRILNLLLKDDELVSRSEHQRLAVEVALLKAATLPRLRSVESVLRGEGGSPSPAPRREPPPARPASAATATPTRSEKASTAPAEPVSRPSSEGDFRDQLVEAVRAQKKMTAGYLAEAQAIEVSGSRLTIRFSAAQKFAADYLRDAEQVAILKSFANGISGKSLEVDIVTAEAEEARPKAAQKNGIDDPVLKALSKHLGAEVVPQRNKATEGR